MSHRKIIHIDMDAFFASVEIRDNPSLKASPVAVGGSRDQRGVIAAASYVARKYGVRSAMPTHTALKLCPDLVLIPCNFEKYKEESRFLHHIFRRFSDKIEPLSLDEAYLDVTGKLHCDGSATLMASEIRRCIYEERNLTASAGIAPNKFLAKVASDWNKPNGQFVIPPENVSTFIETLPIEKIYGIGNVTSKKMHSLNIYTCSDLQRCDIGILERHFGNRAYYFHQLSNGIDNREVETDWIRKSISIEDTYPHNLNTIEECYEKIPQLFERFMHRYENIQHCYYPTKLFVKLKFFDFTSTTVESCLYKQLSIKNFIELITTGYNRKQIPVRLLGIGVQLSIAQSSQLTFW